MRRVASVVLFVLGGWLLTSELMMAWISPRYGFGEELAILGVFMVLALPLLLFGTWTSPGHRWRELGLTLMIAAGSGLFVALALLAVMYDPSMKQFMPPDKPMPRFELSPVIGAVNLLLVAGLGWLLFRRPRRTNSAQELAERFR